MTTVLGLIGFCVIFYIAFKLGEIGIKIGCGLLMIMILLGILSRCH